MQRHSKNENKDFMLSEKCSIKIGNSEVEPSIQYDKNMNGENSKCPLGLDYNYQNYYLLVNGQKL